VRELLAEKKTEKRWTREMLEPWQAILGLIVGLVILVLSSERTIDQLVRLGSLIGLSTFTIGFVISAIGSDLPELVNSVLSAYVGHGEISVGDSLGSAATQISLVLGVIPFFCQFCRLIPRKFAIVGMVEVVVLAAAIGLTSDGYVSRFDGVILIILWGASIYILKRFGGDQVAVESSEAIKVPNQKFRLLVLIVLGFLGIGVGSYLIIESVITISTLFGVSEFIISFFLVAIGTSLPELAVGVAAIRRSHYELALGDLIGSCIVDVTLAIGVGPVLFPITVTGSEILITGLYTVFLSLVVVLLLAWRGINDKRSGALFMSLYGLSYLMISIL
jgi:cation:H+ antiporter